MKLANGFIIGGIGAIDSGVTKTSKDPSPEEAAGELLLTIKRVWRP